MSYQVLARKWRPRSFQEMVGQEHVLRALINALDKNRLHHAYLFTGTRGVGKTTIGRILAKCLNCETGIVSRPCEQCSACCEISEGRFVDLIEIDAASRTKVEDMRELLDNVQYAPTRGRFKVYLIDEVHMLSQSSFNALLKTLEEPPPHVKFLLATTDPQKLPVTILSRCLQFSLKNMAPDKIVSHLQHILATEEISYEENALWLLARAADGSMRDALSLTDQAIAFGNQTVNETDVSAMLGTIDQRKVYALLDKVALRQPSEVLAIVAELSEFSPDYSNVLATMLTLLHRIAIEQMVPGTTDNQQGDKEDVQRLAAQMTAEDVQLFYQIALIGRKDLPLMPDARAGLEMILLRMLAFQPNVEGSISPVQLSIASTAGVEKKPETTSVVPVDVVVDPVDVVVDSVDVVGDPDDTNGHRPIGSLPVTEPVSSSPIAADREQIDSSKVNSDVAQITVNNDAQNITPVFDELTPPDDVALYESELSNAPEDLQENPPFDLPGSDDLSRNVQDVVGASVSSDTVMSIDGNKVSGEVVPVVEVADEVLPETVHLGSDAEDHIPLTVESWAAYFHSLPLLGLTYSLASHSNIQLNDNALTVIIQEGQFRLFNDTHQKRMSEVLRTRLGDSFSVNYQAGESVIETPAQWKERKVQERQLAAVESLRRDENVQQLIDKFSAELILDTVEPIDG